MLLPLLLLFLFFIQHPFTHIHSLMAEATMQGTTCSSINIHPQINGRATGNNLGFSILPRNTRLQRPENQTTYLQILGLLPNLLSHSHLTELVQTEKI